MQVSVTSPFRPRTIRSLSGHIISFERNQTLNIPESLLEEAISIGLVPTAEVDVALGEDVVPKAPVIGDERDNAIRKAISVMRARKERGDWTGTANPAKEVVSSLVGFKVDQREATKVFKAMKDEERAD